MPRTGRPVVFGPKVKRLQVSISQRGLDAIESSRKDLAKLLGVRSNTISDSDATEAAVLDSQGLPGVLMELGKIPMSKKR